MDFSLTTLFVVPVGNTVPTTNSTDALTAGKTGIFLPDYTVATAGNVANAKYIYVVQGRKEPYLAGTKKSDKIAKNLIIETYKSIGGGSATNQVTTVTNFTAKCEQEVVVTLRLHSYYIDTTFYNGLQRSVIVKGDCCDCGGDPCAALDAAGHEAMVDSFVAKINAEVMLSQFVVASKTGTGLTAALVITGKPVKQDNKVGYQSDLSVNPFQRDRLIFRVFVTHDADTTADFLDTDACVSAADVALTTRATYGPKNSAAEVRMLQEYYHSYQSIHKDLFSNPLWNNTYEDFIDDTKNYHLLYIKFREYDESAPWGMKEPIDETVIIAYPTDNNTDIETILETYLGAFSEAGNNINADTPPVGNTTL